MRSEDYRGEKNHRRGVSEEGEEGVWSMVIWACFDDDEVEEVEGDAHSDGER